MVPNLSSADFTAEPSNIAIDDGVFTVIPIRKKMYKNNCCCILITTFFFCLFGVSVGQNTLSKPDHQKPGKSTTPAYNKKINIESFDVIWRTIKDSHWDPEKVGQSWDEHREKLYPKIQEAKSIDEAREIMGELISGLKQSHFGVIPADAYSIIEGEDVKGGDSNIGLTIRLIDNQLIVTAVRDDSSAAQSGVKPGWTIKSIRDRDAGLIIEKLKEVDAGPQRLETTVGLAMRNWCSGSDGSEITIQFEDSEGSQKQMELSCGPVPGKFAQFGNLPPIRVADETRTLENNIGYYRFSAFLDPIRIMPAYRKAIRDSNHTGGIVIDLRGNIGGIAAMTMGMAGEFVTEKQKLGTLMMKGTNLDFIANPRANPYSAPVAVLVDECSISSAEIFAGGLKDLGLAKVFGFRTAGLALPSTVIKLPNGDGFQYAFADYHSANGKTLEINGVIPDETVELTRQKLTEQNDPALRAAIDWIRSKNNL